MKKLLVNVDVRLEDGQDFFTVDAYRIYPVRYDFKAKEDSRRHKQNASVKFNGNQEDSILFKNVIITSNRKKPRKRKLIDDVLVLGSLLNGRNWELYSRISYRYPSAPLIPKHHLEDLGLDEKVKIESYFNAALEKIRDTTWQKQYENGFHLRMLLNHANIIHLESRFLSNVVIWEWLYLHLTNPNRLEKKYPLNFILNNVIKNFWPNMAFDGNNIFFVLRNQLAHSGKLPIDRGYAEPWMTQLVCNGDDRNPGVKQYLKFFDRLTQVVVLKTLDIDAEIIGSHELSNFLKNGKL